MASNRKPYPNQAPLIAPAAVGGPKIVGYKAPNFLSTGYIYAPYIPLHITSFVNVKDFFKDRPSRYNYSGEYFLAIGNGVPRDKLVLD